nr:MAG: RNA-dependent RNA polymerase [Mbeech associated narna-like virus 2]
MRNFKTPNGVFKSNVGLESSKLEVLPIRETLLEASEFLATYGFTLENHDLTVVDKEISSEVGDDELHLSNSKAMIGFLAVMQRKLGMKMSVEDTSVSCHYGNFAEDLIVLPSGYGQTYTNARNTSGINAMSYMDVPKLRLAIDIRPMRMDHSGTNDGKASMIGARMRWIPLESPIRGIYECFNLFQDVNLGLHRDKKFPYLPASLGGYGKEPPFRNYLNLERFMSSFKQGTHSELIREVVQRTINFLTKVEKRENPEKDLLLSHIVRYQSSFHDWVKGRSIYAPVTWIDVPPEVAKHRIAKTGTSPTLDEAINRLLSEGELISESKLEIAVEHNALCKALLGAENILEFKKIRDKARTEWNNLSIFGRESYGLIKELNLEMPNRLRPLRGIDAKLFFDLVNSKRYNLRHILRQEFVYSRKAMDEIYKVGPMSVNFSMLPRVGEVTRGFAARSSDYRTDVEDTDYIDSVEKLSEWFTLRQQGKITKMPRILINDDEEIIQSCTSVYNIIVTDDKKLCRLANTITGNVIFRLPCSWYYKNMYYGLCSYTDYLDTVWPGLNWNLHEDTGSIKSFEEGYFRDGVMLSRPASQKFNIWKTEENWKDPVVLEEFLDYSDDVPTDVESYFYDRKNILKRSGRHKSAFGKTWR